MPGGSAMDRDDKMGSAIFTGGRFPCPFKTSQWHITGLKMLGNLSWTSLRNMTSKEGCLIHMQGQCSLILGFLPKTAYFLSQIVCTRVVKSEEALIPAGLFYHLGFAGLSNAVCNVLLRQHPILGHDQPSSQKHPQCLMERQSAGPRCLTTGLIFQFECGPHSLIGEVCPPAAHCCCCCLSCQEEIIKRGLWLLQESASA